MLLSESEMQVLLKTQITKLAHTIGALVLKQIVVEPRPDRREQ